MNMLLYVVYDTGVWSEFGYTIQRYIGNAATAGIKLFMPVFGIGLVMYIIHTIIGANK